MKRHTIRLDHEVSLSRQETANFDYCGAIVVVHQRGPGARFPGARQTVAIVALPGETSQQAIERHGLHAVERDVIVNFNLNLGID